MDVGNPCDAAGDVGEEVVAGFAEERDVAVRPSRQRARRAAQRMFHLARPVSGCAIEQTTRAEWHKSPMRLAATVSSVN
jgi:hypothetical protein